MRVATAVTQKKTARTNTLHELIRVNQLLYIGMKDEDGDRSYAFRSATIAQSAPHFVFWHCVPTQSLWHC